MEGETKGKDDALTLKIETPKSSESQRCHIVVAPPFVSLTIMLWPCGLVLVQSTTLAQSDTMSLALMIHGPSVVIERFAWRFGHRRASRIALVRKFGQLGPAGMILRGRFRELKIHTINYSYIWLQSDALKAARPYELAVKPTGRFWANNLVLSPDPAISQASFQTCVPSSSIMTYLFMTFHSPFHGIQCHWRVSTHHIMYQLSYTTRSGAGISSTIPCNNLLAISALKLIST